jgi:hypothetical protein
VCDLIGNILVGLITSAIVAVFFYRLAKRDSESLRRQAQLDEVSIKLRQLDPLAWDDNFRHHYGVNNMNHWLICMAEVMEETGFATGGEELRRIAGEMLQVCPGLNSPSQSNPEEAAQKKMEWKRAVSELRNTLPLSLLNRKSRK